MKSGLWHPLPEKRHHLGWGCLNSPKGPVGHFSSFARGCLYPLTFHMVGGSVGYWLGPISLSFPHLSPKPMAQPPSNREMPLCMMATIDLFFGQNDNNFLFFGSYIQPSPGCTRKPFHPPICLQRRSNFGPFIINAFNNFVLLPYCNYFWIINTLSQPAFWDQNSK